MNNKQSIDSQQSELNSTIHQSHHNFSLDESQSANIILLKPNQRENSDDQILQVKDIYRNKYKWLFLSFSTMVFIGGFFNNSFQAFIKEQFMSAMDINNSQYGLFVLIPPIPNFILPIFAGAILDKLGIRKAIFFFTLMMLIGMSFCLISSYSISFTLMIIGKTIHQIGSEMLCISQNSIITKWFGSTQLTSAYTIGSFVQKSSSSLSGLLFPEFYQINNDLQIPLIVSVCTCIFSLLSATAVVFMDKTADKRMCQIKESKSGKKIVNIKFKDLKTMGIIYWVYAIQAGICFGGFYAFINYLQTILVKKFTIDRMEAGQMVSIPFWIALTAPIFGYLADNFGKRIFCLAGAILMGWISIFLLMVISANSDIGIIYVCLIMFGLFISALQGYIYPCYPLICERRFIGTAFGIGYGMKNLGLSIFSYIGGGLLGKNEDQLNSFFAFYLALFTFSFVLQIVVYFIDKKKGGNLNCSQPQIPEDTQKIINILQSFQV